MLAACHARLVDRARAGARIVAVIGDAMEAVIAFDDVSDETSSAADLFGTNPKIMCIEGPDDPGDDGGVHPDCGRGTVGCGGSARAAKRNRFPGDPRRSALELATRCGDRTDSSHFRAFCVHGPWTRLPGGCTGPVDDS